MGTTEANESDKLSIELKYIPWLVFRLDDSSTYNQFNYSQNKPKVNLNGKKYVWMILNVKLFLIVCFTLVLLALKYGVTPVQMKSDWCKL